MQASIFWQLPVKPLNFWAVLSKGDIFVVCCHSSVWQAKLAHVLLHSTRFSLVFAQGRAWLPKEPDIRQCAQCHPNPPRLGNKGHRLQKKAFRLPAADGRPGGIPLPNKVGTPPTRRPNCQKNYVSGSPLSSSGRLIHVLVLRTNTVNVSVHFQ